VCKPESLHTYVYVYMYIYTDVLICVYVNHSHFPPPTRYLREKPRRAGVRDIRKGRGGNRNFRHDSEDFMEVKRIG